MDALYDDSDIFNLNYSIKNLSPYSKKLEFQAYNSKVEHPMSTKYRNARMMPGKTDYMTHFLTTEMTGVKVKNSVDAFGQNISYGIDGSQRNWDGAYSRTNENTGVVTNIRKSIDDVDTKNMGVFIKSKKTMGKVALEMGARYDDTSIDTKTATKKDKNYNALSANIFANYHADDSTKYFAGLGKSSRVPDGRELYNVTSTGIINGNDNLNQTTNYELDLGVEKNFDNATVKIKTFYSKLKDYISYNSSTSTFENIDAAIYGVELGASYMPTDDIYLSTGLAYKKGKKDANTGQTGTNLAEITPLKLNATAAYDYDENGMVEVSLIAADKWNNVDTENGEQTLAGYGVVNLKTTRTFDNGLEFTLGVDNAFDKNYATTNTYRDLILMTTPTDNTMLINEPGRYVYLNAKYAF
jgi:iron complex outermembrane receptor protein